MSTHVFPSHGHQVVGNSTFGREQSIKKIQLLSQSFGTEINSLISMRIFLDREQSGAALLCTSPILQDTSYQTLATSQVPLGKGVGAGRLKFCSVPLTKASVISVVGSQHSGWRETGSHRDNSRGRCSDSHSFPITTIPSQLLQRHRRDPSSP